MAVIGPSGRDVPALSDAADAPAAFLAYDTSGVPILPASSAAHANQRVAEFRTAGGIEPALIWREDVRQLHHHPNTGAAGETAAFLAGQQAGVDLHMAGSIPPRTNPLTVLTSAQFGAVGAGITTRWPDDAHSRAWQRWAESSACDAEGRLDLYGLQALVMRAVVESGECFLRFLMVPPSPANPIGLRLQVLESDHLDTARARRSRP